LGEHCIHRGPLIGLQGHDLANALSDDIAGLLAQSSRTTAHGSQTTAPSDDKSLVVLSAVGWHGFRRTNDTTWWRVSNGCANAATCGRARIESKSGPTNPTSNTIEHVNNAAMTFAEVCPCIVKAFDQCQQLFECAALRVHHEACRGCFPSLHFPAINVEHAAGSSAGPLAAPLPPTKLSGELG
jgi:hypothetical protein